MWRHLGLCKTCSGIFVVDMLEITLHTSTNIGWCTRISMTKLSTNCPVTVFNFLVSRSARVSATKNTDLIFRCCMLWAGVFRYVVISGVSMSLQYFCGGECQVVYWNSGIGLRFRFFSLALSSYSIYDMAFKINCLISYICSLPNVYVVR